MAELKVRVHALPRASLPADLGLGEALVARLEASIAAGRTGMVALVVRPDVIEQIGLGAVREAGLPVPWFLAALSRTQTMSGGPVEAVGIAGRAALRPRPDAPAVPMATVFLEWSDNRWWQWQALVDAEGRLRADTARVRLAEAGDPMPARLGRWWSMGRRGNVTARLDPTPPPGPVH